MIEITANTTSLVIVGEVLMNEGFMLRSELEAMVFEMFGTDRNTLEQLSKGYLLAMVRLGLAM